MMYDLFHFDSNEKVKHATVRYFMKSDAHHLAREIRERERGGGYNLQVSFLSPIRRPTT